MADRFKPRRKARNTAKTQDKPGKSLVESLIRRRGVKRSLD
jgi:hypothetical protein